MPVPSNLSISLQNSIETSNVRLNNNLVKEISYLKEILSEKEKYIECLKKQIFSRPNMKQEEDSIFLNSNSLSSNNISCNPLQTKDQLKTPNTPNDNLNTLNLINSPLSFKNSLISSNSSNNLNNLNKTSIQDDPSKFSF